MKCLHHTDADGKLAAYWVHDRYPVMKPEDFIMIGYGIMDVDWFSRISEGEHVIIVDFSLEPDDMRKLLKKTKNVVWIDHHKTAIEKYDGFEEKIKGLRYDGIAACMLTWAYYNEINEGRKLFDPSLCIKAPWMTKYVADHDVWRFDYGSETAHFKLGLDAKGDIGPFSKVWDDLLQIDEVTKTIKDGIVIERYRDSLGERACDINGFESNIEGHKTFCLNNVFGGSEWFGKLIKEYDMVCAFSYMGKNKVWEYSLYSEKIDTSVISKKYGGGGHAGASGFTSKEFIFG